MLKYLLILSLFLSLQSSAYYHFELAEQPNVLRKVSDTVPYQMTEDTQGFIKIDTGITGSQEGAVRIQTQNSDQIVLGGESYTKAVVGSDRFVYFLNVKKVKEKGDEHIIIQIIVQPYDSK